MLLQFNITNYRSFKDETILSLMANSDKEHSERLIPFNKENVLPSIAIYGANAAGKSNIFKALTTAILLVRLSNTMQIGQKIPVQPFALGISGDTKTQFDFIFVSEGVKYEYGFVFDTDKVYEEYLYEYKTAKPSKIFERSNVNEYNYTAALKNKLKPYESKNTDNKLFLATATAWNCQETKGAYIWFEQYIDTYNQDNLLDTIFNHLDQDNNLHKEHLIKWLKTADFNISDYVFQKQEHLRPYPEIVFNPDNEKEGKIQLNKFRDVMLRLDMFHEIESEQDVQSFSLPIHEESTGTITFFAFLLPIINTLEKGRTIAIDQIDKDLHPILLQNIVDWFNDPEINKNGAQLLFNTHDVTLLDLDILRRDQIYFVEKDNRTGVSELYSLDEYSPRKSEKVQKGYLQGRYGAIPNIGGFVPWEK